MRILLNQIAFARPGDKGNDSDITVFARSAEAHTHLGTVLTADVVRQQYGTLVRGEVFRWEVPKVWAWKFMLHDALGGGGPSSLRADNLGKALAGVILRLEIDVSETLALHHVVTEVPTDPYAESTWRLGSMNHP